MVKKPFQTTTPHFYPLSGQQGQLNSRNFSHVFARPLLRIRSAARKTATRGGTGAFIGELSLCVQGPVAIRTGTAGCQKDAQMASPIENYRFLGVICSKNRPKSPRFRTVSCYTSGPYGLFRIKTPFLVVCQTSSRKELVTVLSQKKSFEFKQLFAIVHANLRQRNAASGGEEMLRLRAYEKLQILVARCRQKKTVRFKGRFRSAGRDDGSKCGTSAAIASNLSAFYDAGYLPVLLQVIVAIGFAEWTV